MPLDSVRRHATPLIFLATALSVPLWLWLGAWLRQDVSGWSELAASYAAGERPLTNSQGTATVALQRPGRPRQELRYEHGATFIEVGIDGTGFWLRSRESTPQPALYIPWARVRSCSFTAVNLVDSDILLRVQLQAVEDACAAHIRQRGY